MAQDIFKQIHEDHVEVTKLLEQMRAQPERMPEQNAMKLAEELLPHAKSEEFTLYHMLREYDEALSHILKATEEHGVIAAALEMLGDAKGDPERLVAKVTVIQQLIEAHVKEEEGRTFDLARDLLSDDQLEELARAFPEQKEKLRPQIMQHLRKAA